MAALFAACGSVFDPFEAAPDTLPDGSIADVRTARDSSDFSDRSSFPDVGRDAARDGTGGNADRSSGASGSGGTAGTGAGGTGTGGGGGGAGATAGSGGATAGSGGASGGSAGAGGASTGGAGGATGGSGGAGGVAGSAGTGGAGGSGGARVLVQGHIGTIGMTASPIGNIRIVHARISTPSSRLCNGAMCVTGGLTP